MTAHVVVLLVVAAACGGGRSPSPAAVPDETTRSTKSTPPPRPPAPSCPAGQIMIEHCVVGGMPNEDGTANVSCGTSCSAAPPAGSPGQECQQVAPDRYRCTAYAP